MDAVQSALTRALDFADRSRRGFEQPPLMIEHVIEELEFCLPVLKSIEAALKGR